ncbi:MAG TPA: threonine aldolase, partial [Lachnospiraceae bacterium]|nr:threonine aldolase [Lachnospiraceae bacterium]
SSTTGHINIHECGAIEATGHKVLTPPYDDGKLTPELIAPILEAHEDEFFVHPAMVYISNPTEVGTIYTKRELEALSSYCKANNLLLFLDGARLPMALAVPECNLEMKDFQNLVDILFIGGTKVGALFGEALVLFKKDLQQRFRFSMKHRGAMLAKGWLLGVQFEQLFMDGLYYELGRHAVKMALLLKDAMSEAGISFLTDSKTNQQFPILPNKLKALIEEKYCISDWSKPDENHTCVRFCTSWATKEEDVQTFIKDFKTMYSSLR